MRLPARAAARPDTNDPRARERTVNHTRRSVRAEWHDSSKNNVQLMYVKNTLSEYT